MAKDEKLNVLVFGSGAREHAICEAISASPLLGKIYQAAAGFSKFGEEIKYRNFEDLAQKCSENKTDLAFIGPEEPICEGIADIFLRHNIPCIAPSKHFSQLESSKIFGKNFMEKYGINTAKYHLVRDISDFRAKSYPVVIKADGLCKGKGVVIAYNQDIAEKTIQQYLGGKFGENSKTVIVEEFIDGEEISLMSLFDGKTLLNFLPARDFKKLNKSPCAPNTGGMGAFCPVSLSEVQQQKLNEYQMRLQNALIQEKADFTGFLYSGLIWDSSDWKVLEYNVRLGDPETQAILTHLKTDFLSVLSAAAERKLEGIKLEYKSGTSACLVIASKGYPQNSIGGDKIDFTPEAGIKVFYAGVEKNSKGETISKGGRVLSLCTTGESPFRILKSFAKRIKMNNKYFRSDIDIQQ